jgi:hypothetical protein
MEEIYSIDTDEHGATTIVTQSTGRRRHAIIKLSPKASAELTDHLIHNMNVTIRFKANTDRFLAIAGEGLEVQQG